MKRFSIIALLCIMSLHLYAQKAIIYYEGLCMYPIEKYAYEFHSLIDSHRQSNPVCEITDSTFLSFLSKKIESIERCTQEDECIDATYKPTAMIQIVYVENRTCYYTLDLNSFGELKSLTIDGKSCVPDEDLQEVVAEIVKFCNIKKRAITHAELQAILKGAKCKEEPYWPLRLPRTN